MLADLCRQHKKLYATAVRFYADAFADRPEAADPLQNFNRYNAACAAALAAAGQGQEPTSLDDEERARLRRQALDWLRADLAVCAQHREKGAPQARAVCQTLRHWQQDADLAGVRDATPLANLSDPEGAHWQRLWADVDALQKRAAGPK